VPDHIEMIVSRDMQQPAVYLAQCRHDAVADTRGRLEAEAVIEQSLRRFARFRVRIPRVGSRGERVQEPEQRA
jgi:hypothetical protein